MAKQTEPPAPIRISTNTILNGKFYVAGDPLPVDHINDLPDNLKSLVIGELEAEEPDEPRGAYELNTPYRVTDDNRLGRRVQRQISEMEAATAEEAWIEEQMDAPLPAEIVQDLQQEHESHVAQQAAQAAADAARADAISDGAAADGEPPELYVRRGVRHYSPAARARLTPGEPVFVRAANGTFQFIGETDSKCGLPDPPITV